MDPNTIAYRWARFQEMLESGLTDPDLCHANATRDDVAVQPERLGCEASVDEEMSDELSAHSQ